MNPPPDRDALNAATDLEREREALAIWQADRRARLAENLLAHRPDEFATPGDLNPDLAGWSEDLAAGRGRNLIITGPVGTGETWALWHAAEHAVRAGYEGGIIITAATRLRRVVAPATADPAEFDRYRLAGLLAVDDLGAVRLSEWDMDHLAELADARWADHRPTVITSNVSALRDLLGPRISSRLQHNALVLELDGPDRRRQQP
jgi:DNA replication protein DnaC